MNKPQINSLKKIQTDEKANYRYWTYQTKNAISLARSMKKRLNTSKTYELKYKELVKKAWKFLASRRNKDYYIYK